MSGWPEERRGRLNRLVAGGALVGVLVMLCTSLYVARTAGAHGEAGADRAADSDVRHAAESHDLEGRPAAPPERLALFQAIVRAEEKAIAEALARFPVRSVRGLPTAPTAGLDKASGKRNRFADLRFGELLDEIGRQHWMTPGEVEAIYRRGRDEDWKTQLVNEADPKRTAPEATDPEASRREGR